MFLRKGRWTGAAIVLTFCLGVVGCSAKSNPGLSERHSQITLGSSQQEVTTLLGSGSAASLRDSHAPEAAKTTTANQYVKWTVDAGVTILVGFNDGKVVFKEKQYAAAESWGSYAGINKDNVQFDGVAVPKAVEGPTIKIETALKAGMKLEQVEALLGPPLKTEKLTNYNPPFTMAYYDQWGLRMRFHGRLGLCEINVSRRWDKPLHGLRVGDKLMEAHEAQPLLSNKDGSHPPPKSFHQLEPGKLHYRLWRHSLPIAAPRDRFHRPFESGWALEVWSQDPWLIREIKFFDPERFGEWRTAGLFGF